MGRETVYDGTSQCPGGSGPDTRSRPHPEVPPRGERSGPGATAVTGSNFLLSFSLSIVMLL